jgi:hypothetical protein
MTNHFEPLTFLSFFPVEKQSDEGEQYDDAMMENSSLANEKSSTARYVTPAKSG